MLYSGSWRRSHDRADHPIPLRSYHPARTNQCRDEYLPPGVRALLAVMEASERKFGSIMPPESMSPKEHVRDVAPYLFQPT